MAYTSRRIGLLGGLINTGTRAAGDLWARVQAHTPGTDRFSLLSGRGEATDQWSGSLMP